MLGNPLRGKSIQTNWAFVMSLSLDVMMPANGCQLTLDKLNTDSIEDLTADAWLVNNSIEAGPHGPASKVSWESGPHGPVSPETLHC